MMRVEAGVYQQELEVALAAVKQASLLCRNVQSAIGEDVLEKKDRSPVTIADYGSQAIICKALQSAFPEDPVIGEEDATELRQLENTAFVDRIHQELQEVDVNTTADEFLAWIDHANAKQYCDRFWTLDPIDGTKGFLRKEQYAVALALIVNGEIVLGLLGCPKLTCSLENQEQSGSLLFAIRDCGSYELPVFGSAANARTIEVSSTADTAQARLCESVESGHSAHSRSAHIADQLGINQEPVRLDSQAKYATVARGAADIYLRLPAKKGYQEKIWDHAAGVIVVEEAGGQVTDITGNPLDFCQGQQLTENRGVVVSNKLLHDQVIAAIADSYAKNPSIK